MAVYWPRKFMDFLFSFFFCKPSDNAYKKVKEGFELKLALASAIFSLYKVVRQLLYLAMLIKNDSSSLYRLRKHKSHMAEQI